MIIKIDKKDIDLYQEACAQFGLSFTLYTIETNELMVSAEIMIEDQKPLEPSHALCVYLGIQVQINWEKRNQKDTEVLKSAWRGTTKDLPQRE